jgi:hypothetical protein
MECLTLLPPLPPRDPAKGRLAKHPARRARPAGIAGYNTLHSPAMPAGTDRQETRPENRWPTMPYLPEIKARRRLTGYGGGGAAARRKRASERRVSLRMLAGQ